MRTLLGVRIKEIAMAEGKTWASKHLHLFLKRNLPHHPRSWCGVLKVICKVRHDWGAVLFL